MKSETHFFLPNKTRNNNKQAVVFFKKRPQCENYNLAWCMGDFQWSDWTHCASQLSSNPYVAQFSLSNVHKRGVKHHHFISNQYVGGIMVDPCIKFRGTIISESPESSACIFLPSARASHEWATTERRLTRQRYEPPRTSPGFSRLCHRGATNHAESAWFGLIRGSAP